MTRAYESKELLQQKIIKGANVLADNVASTLGPKGRNVLLQEKDKAPINASTMQVQLSEIFGQIVQQLAIKKNHHDAPKK